MQWDSAPNGGFTEDSVEPWMRVNTSTAEINVAQQSTRKDSVLNFWRHMLATRQAAKDVLIHGRFELVDEANNKVFSFFKHGKNRSALVICNFSSSEVAVPQFALDRKRELLMDNMSEQVDEAVLAPWEGRIYTLPPLR